MPQNLQTVAEEPFRIIWQLPAYPGARLVACGAHITALHFWQQRTDRILVYGKVELTACYENKKTEGKLHFADITRYLSVDMDTKSAVDLEQGIKGSLVAGPICTLVNDTSEQPVVAEGNRNEVQVEGVIQLQVPVLEHEEGPQEVAAVEPMASTDRSQQIKGPWPSYTGLPSVEPLSQTVVTSDRPVPNSSKPALATPQRAPFLPRGAESIPPMIWAMPERG